MYANFEGFERVFQGLLRNYANVGSRWHFKRIISVFLVTFCATMAIADRRRMFEKCIYHVFSKMRAIEDGVVCTLVQIGNVDGDVKY